MFTAHILNLEQDLSGEKSVLKQYENLSHKEVVQELLVHTNDYLKHIDNDILIVHKQLRDLYSCRFSELESIILNPVDYARSVRLVGNTSGDISHVLEQM